MKKKKKDKIKSVNELQYLLMSIDKLYCFPCFII